MQEQFWLELEREAKPARRLLERIPSDRLDWRPHPNSRTLGDLAWHMASIPLVVSGMVQGTTAERTAVIWPTQPRDMPAALDNHLEQARTNLARLNETALASAFTVTVNSREIVQTTRAGFLRWAMLTHFIHHRAQLGLYLRLLDLPVPSIVGPSFDENPFLPKT